MGDTEYGVTTLLSKGGENHAYRHTPCEQCPWRKDSPIGAFPPDAYRHSARTAYDMADSTFSCHVAGKDKPQTCAGFLLQSAEHNMQVRIGLMTGRLDLSRLHDGGVSLYDSYREMAEANGVPADDPALKPCRPYVDEEWWKNRDG